MPIVVEGEKSGVGIVRFLMWLAILVIAGTSVYYVFFVEPQLVDVAIPKELEQIDPLVSVSLSPEEVINVLESLRPHVAPPVAGNAGRSNPFVAP